MSTTSDTFPLLVAEVANCHGGSEEYLFALLDRLLATGADAVKFQPIVAPELVASRHPMYGIFDSLQMPASVWREASTRIHRAGKLVGFDAYGEGSLSIALECGADLLKVHASDIDNPDFVGRVLDIGLPVFVSTGGASPEEIDRIATLRPSATICLQVGFQAYPTPAEESHLNRIPTIAARYGRPVGYMDHVSRDDLFASVLPCLSLAKGAASVEKHVYLPERETKYDWQAALSPEELDRVYRLMLTTVAALGRSELVRSPLEEEYSRKTRRVAVTRTAIAPGDALSPDVIVFVRAVPDTAGAEPVTRAVLPSMLGRRAARAIAADTTLTRDMFL